MLYSFQTKIKWEESAFIARAQLYRPESVTQRKQSCSIKYRNCAANFLSFTILCRKENMTITKSSLLREITTLMETLPKIFQKNKYCTPGHRNYMIDNYLFKDDNHISDSSGDIDFMLKIISYSMI